MAERNRLHRSELAVPGSNTRMLEKAPGAGADMVFLDLEDAVAPDAKETARAQVAAFLTPIYVSRVEIVLQPRFLEIVGHDLRSRRERRLHPGLDPQPERRRVARQQARAQHHGGVGGVRAGRDCGNDHGAVFEVEILVLVIYCGYRRPVGLALVMADRGIAAFVFKRPTGIPSPLSPSRNL